jgi:hypothetical protein
MRAKIRREWLQKHPTPRAGDGDFHWFPGAADPALLTEIAAGVAGELTLWFEPGRVVCARRFTDVAPGDGRRYTGIAAAIAEHPTASAAALLAALPVPDAAPWTSARTDPTDAPVSDRPPSLPAAIAALDRRVVVGAPSDPVAASPAPIAARAAAAPTPQPLSRYLLAALAVSLATNLLLALALFARGSTVHGTVEPNTFRGNEPLTTVHGTVTPDAGVVPMADASVPVPDAAVAPDAALAPPEKPKPKPAPPRRRRKY